jgi:hypothetical protein
MMLLSALLVSAAAQNGVYQAPSREPTPEEVLVLELINRFRADPAGEAERVLASAARGPDSIDRAMFKREMEALKPAPPLVFNLKLLDAARKHSHYMILNELTHVEVKGRPGFVAADMGRRIGLAGYEGGLAGENCFRDADSVLESHVGFVIDWGSDDGGSRGGMQSRRGHRSNMHNPEFREIGPGVLPHEGRVSVTHNLGDRPGPARLAGGVVYADLDGDGAYDPGEGRGGVSIATEDGRASTTTWGSGAWVLELRSTDAVTLVASDGAAQSVGKFDAGKQNVKFDWIIPNEVLVQSVGKLVADVEKIPDTEPNARKRFAARVALYQGTRGIGLASLGSELQEKTEALLEGIGERVEPALEAVRAAIKKEDVKATAKAIDEGRKLLRGTVLEGWLADADAYDETLRLIAAAHKKAGPRLAKTEAAAAVKELEKREKRFKTAEWKSAFRARLDALAESGR